MKNDQKQVLENFVNQTAGEVNFICQVAKQQRKQIQDSAQEEIHKIEQEAAEEINAIDVQMIEREQIMQRIESASKVGDLNLVLELTKQLSQMY